MRKTEMIFRYLLKSIAQNVINICNHHKKINKQKNKFCRLMIIFVQVAKVKGIIDLLILIKEITTLVVEINNQIYTKMIQPKIDPSVSVAI